MQVLRTEGRDKMRVRRPFRAAWVVVLLAGTLLVPRASGQTVIHVTETGSDPLGANWSNATSFTNALAIAQPNDAIWLKQGTYTNPLTNFMVTASGLKLYGGFAGTETDLSQRDWTNNVVMLNGQAARLVIEIKAHNVTLDGLTITNGLNNTTDNTKRKGAGLRMDGGSYPATNLTMANCWVVNNYDSTDSCTGGGAYFNNAGNVLISNCVFAMNRAYQGNGAGIYSLNSNLTVIDSRISKNTIEGGYRKNGVGICFAGVSNTLVIRRCEIIDNGTTSTGEWQGGGGVYIASGTASIVNAVIARNRSPRSGGGVYHNSGTLTIESCTFVTNMPAGTYKGGAIYQNSGNVTVKNCIFWDNQASGGVYGDTIYQTNGTLNLSYSCMDGTNSPRVVYAGTLNFGSGIITNDPLFAVPYTDVHLKSKLGRWNGSDWVRDDVSSPCIDAGDPASDESLEPDGSYINLGAYGNTPEASRVAARGTIFIIK